ncbi:MAG: site-specific DNA-methyltransferase [Candidatus Marinimicrobia bacterium]|nr:site-specific DNA-methyltransferase [Candidatus Neomarinimicrobiota bacterium]MCF7827881.1 site-specific DNA-methyltransferase [Candidatus Neomarinimicrobiota bacterium]MCF7879364.1 site-specific DNA-methyltransferase [Candidatus Neomarinimicrobiota bacterium]
MVRLTTHTLHFTDARSLDGIDDKSIQLIVTSPPYPMIEMWDEIFAKMNPEIGAALSNEEGSRAFDLMHGELEKVWTECTRVLSPGGMLCINIGDATRTVGGDFRLWSNHAEIIRQCESLGLQNLPNILWRKPTNSPTKFMGSGMLPPGAYVTLEHEYILVFRKGGKRVFRAEEEKQNRRESAFFWEERNKWFSDVWMDLKGIGQELNDTQLRKRSGAFPLELAYRLINMFSVKGDTVLDPFLGTGTTILASMVGERNSIGVEIDAEFRQRIESQIEKVSELSERIVSDRLHSHTKFVAQREKPLKYQNDYHDTPVVSRQERALRMRKIHTVTHPSKNVYRVEYQRG